MSGPRRRVLIIKLGALGDIMIATPVIRRIQQAEDAAAITILTGDRYAPIFGRWPGLTAQTAGPGGIRGVWHLLRWMRGARFARVYDLQCNDRSRLLCAASGITERIGNAPIFPYTGYPPPAERHHPFERLNAMLAAAGVPPAEPRPWLPATREQTAKVDAWLEAQALGARPIALLHAGASPRWDSKRWPYYPALAARLHDWGYAIIWIGAEPDATLNRALAARIGIDATGLFSVCELAELGRRARLAITSDSGPMHILSASGIPVYAFFGPTDPVRSHALGQAQRVLAHAVVCSPCHLPQCPPQRGHACLRDLPVEAVLARLRKDGLAL
ncbi:MAG: glycosyltransferase family 9 protein [Gammaproteobacteria bacterium]